MNKLYLLIVTLLISNIAIAQWSKKKGDGYYKLSVWGLKSDQHYTDTGDIDPNITRGQYNINLYGEYGITNKINALIYAPLFSSTYQNDVFSNTTKELITKGESVNGIGDIDLGIRYSLLQNEKIALSTSLTLGLPTGNDAGGSDGSYQTGDGEFNQLLKVSVGVPFSIANFPLYSKAYIGYNNRTQNYSDELRLGAEVGINIAKIVWLTANLDVVSSLQNGSLSAQGSQGSIFANNVEFTSSGFGAAVYVTKKLGVSLNYAGAFSGRIIYASPSYSAGIFLDIK